jgi:uncharacterized protein involved in response to NO
VPRCGALSLLQKTIKYRGDPAEAAATLNVKLWLLVVVVVVTGGRVLPLFWNSQAHENLNFAERFEAYMVV